MVYIMVQKCYSFVFGGKHSIIFNVRLFLVIFVGLIEINMYIINSLQVQ